MDSGGVKGYPPPYAARAGEVAAVFVAPRDKDRVRAGPGLRLAVDRAGARVVAVALVAVAVLGVGALADARAAAVFRSSNNV